MLYPQAGSAHAEVMIPILTLPKHLVYSQHQADRQSLMHTWLELKALSWRLGSMRTHGRAELFTQHRMRRPAPRAHWK